jgi:hypothetical protein
MNFRKKCWTTFGSDSGTSYLKEKTPSGSFTFQAKTDKRTWKFSAIRNKACQNIGSKTAHPHYSARRRMFS